MRAGHLTLPIAALLALAACDDGGSDVQQVPEPPASQSEPSVAAGAGPGEDETDDPGVSLNGAQDESDDSGVSGGDDSEGNME